MGHPAAPPGAPVGGCPEERERGDCPLFRVLLDSLRLAHLAERPGAPSVDEMADMQRDPPLSRREFLRAGAAAGLLLASGGIKAPPVEAALQPRIVVVG